MRYKDSKMNSVKRQQIMAILIWKCKGCPVIIAAKLLGFKVGTDLLNCVLCHLQPTILPKLFFT